MKRKINAPKITVNMKARYVLMNIINTFLCLMILSWICILLSGVITQAQPIWRKVGGAFFIINIISNCIVIVCFIALLVNCRIMCETVSFKTKWLIINCSVYLPVMICLQVGISAWNMMWTSRPWIVAIFGSFEILFLAYMLTTNLLLTLKTKKYLQK